AGGKLVRRRHVDQLGVLLRQPFGVETELIDPDRDDTSAVAFEQESGTAIAWRFHDNTGTGADEEVSSKIESLLTSRHDNDLFGGHHHAARRTKKMRD